MKTARWLFGVLLAVIRVTASRIAGRRGRASWSFKTELIQRTMHATLRASLSNGVDWFRSIQDRASSPPFFGKVVEFEEDSLAGVSGEWCVPTAQATERTILYLHGGGYVFGTAESYRDLCSRLAVGAGARVFCPDYRRAPEDMFPAAQNDALAVYRALLERTPASELTLAGDSAGAGLVMATLLSQRDSGGPLPAAASLLCPWVDPFGGGASMHRNESTDIGPATWILWCAETSIPKDSKQDPRVKPVAGELSGLPPMLLQIGEAEMLHDQGIQLAKALTSAGVSTTVHVEPDMFHVWQLLPTQLEQAEEAIAQVCRFARQHS